ncbi:aldolase [Cytobacillus firmus]|nr:aldolase [Cytobacillus firmus]
MIETKKKKYYTAFGLKISSVISLPELPQVRWFKEEEDIIIEIDDLTSVWNKVEYKAGKFLVEKNFVLFQINNTATFCIRDGKKIIVSPMKGADFEKIRLYILGTCMGALLMQRRVLPLHGSAVAINGEAYAFIGQSGAGKSTLSSVFLNKGYQLLSDDVIPILGFEEGNQPLVYPSYPQQKLWKESLHEFGMETNEFRPLFERETKFAIPVFKNFCKKPLPLAGVFEILKTETNEIDIQPISGLQSLNTLYNNTYRKFLIDRLGLREWHFNVTANMANKIQVYQLQRPVSRFTAYDLTSLILNTIKKGK